MRGGCSDLYTCICHILNPRFVVLFYRSWPDNVHVLQACHKLMKVARTHRIQGFLTAENLQEIYGYLRLNLCSASHVVRLLTLKLLTCFDQPETRLSSDDKVQYLTYSQTYDR